MSSHRRSRYHAPIVENHDSNSSPGIINIITSTKTGINAFANDGSFLELFKKKMEEEKSKGSSGTSDGENAKDAENQKKGNPSTVKRRGGKILKTGIVKKPKVEDYNEEEEGNDAWTRYLAEVRKYKQQACDEDSKTRPLVK